MEKKDPNSFVFLGGDILFIYSFGFTVCLSSLLRSPRWISLKEWFWYKQAKCELHMKISILSIYLPIYQACMTCDTPNLSQPTVNHVLCPAGSPQFLLILQYQERTKTKPKNEVF